MVGGEGGRQLFDDLAPGCSKTSLGGKLIRGGGSAARISYELRPQDPGGGDVRIVASWVGGSYLMISPRVAAERLWAEN